MINLNTDRDWSYIGGRIKWARRNAGYESEKAASDALLISQTTLGNHERSPHNGRGVPLEKIKLYARRFAVSEHWIINGGTDPKMKPKATAPTSLKVSGRIGAGAEVIVEEHNGEGWDEEITPPNEHIDDFELYEVMGDSMSPYFLECDIIFFERKLRSVRELLGIPCLVTLDDGRRLLKIPRRGASQGLYDLDSFNAPTLLDQKIAKAAKIAWIKKC